MNIEEIWELWSEDAHISELDLSNESLKLPKLHGKWYKMLSTERLISKKLDEEYNELHLLKHQYYNGIIDEETLKANNWEPNPLRVLKGDIPMYISADKDIIRKKLKIALATEKVNILNDIVKSIANRSFHIRNAIDFLKFRNAEF